MPFKKIEDEIEGCAFKKIDNRKIRKLCYLENLENIERAKEIKSKNIPKDRRLQRLQIQDRLRKKLDERKKVKINKRVGKGPHTPQSTLNFTVRIMRLSWCR